MKSRGCWLFYLHHHQCVNPKSHFLVESSWFVGMTFRTKSFLPSTILKPMILVVQFGGIEMLFFTIRTVSPLLLVEFRSLWLPRLISCSCNFGCGVVDGMRCKVCGSLFRGDFVHLTLSFLTPTALSRNCWVSSKVFSGLNNLPLWSSRPTQGIEVTFWHPLWFFGSSNWRRLFKQPF